MLTRYLVFALAAFCLLCTESSAATLIRQRLVTDGSVDPPGDRIDVVIAFEPDEKEVRLEVHALVVATAEEQSVERVAAKGSRNRDADGRFKKTVIVKRPGTGAIGRFSVAIAYADLTLGPDVHRLAYEVYAYAGEQLQFVKPTRLTKVEVTGRTRSELTLVTATERPDSIVKPINAYRLDGDEKEVRQIELKTTRYRPEEKSTVQKVAIPGEFIRSELATVAKSDGEGRAQPSVPLEELRPKAERTVFFATNRKTSDNGKFAAELSEALRYGSCTVNIPVDSHKRGSLELPPNVRDWWKKYDPGKYFYVYDTRIVPREQFVKGLAEDDVLLYVHGFNNSFENAILSAAQLKHDLEFPGKATTFTWPGDTKRGLGLLGGYRTAEQHATKSVDSLAELLQALLDHRDQASTRFDIHVIAHSLGNRVLLDAVHRLVSDKRVNPGSKVFANVVLAAADVDWPTFAAQAPSLVSCAKRVTYYYSTQDFPLKLSKTLHGDKPPIGLCPLLHPQVDTINADNVNEFAIGFGHRYFSSSNPMLVDLNLLLVNSLMPDGRQPPLGNRQEIAGHAHWEFVPVTN